MHFDSNNTTLSEIHQFVESLETQQFTYKDVIDCWVDYFKKKYNDVESDGEEVAPPIPPARKIVERPPPAEDFSIDSDDEIIVKPKNNNTSIKKFLNRKGKTESVVWTDEEVELLLEEFRKYGRQWTLIYNNHRDFWDIRNRNPRKLSDKYRSILKFNKKS